MKEIALGTIGSGPIVHTILDLVNSTPGISCRAVYSRTQQTGQALAARYQAQKVYTNLEDMLQDPELNVIYIASPNSLHYMQIKLALEHNKHVICEKPFCPKRSQVEEVVALAKQRHLLLADAVPTAFLPNFALLRQQLPKIGKVRLVLCNYTKYSSRYDQVLAGQSPNIFNPQFAGGCLQDINFYNVYFNVALFGKPADVQYYANIYPGLADTSGVAILRYDDFVSSCAGSKDAYGVNFVQIEGEKGCIYAKDGSNGISEIRVITESGEEVLNQQSESNRWTYEVQQLTQLFLSEDYASVYAHLDTTLDVIDTMERARMSAGILFPCDS